MIAAEEWVRLLIGHNRGRRSEIWHRAAGEATVCGVLLAERVWALEERPPPRQRRCRVCEASP